jgi:hypothetical protein
VFNEMVMVFNEMVMVFNEMVMVFNATFNNISVISCWLRLIKEGHVAQYIKFFKYSFASLNIHFEFKIFIRYFKYSFGTLNIHS